MDKGWLVANNAFPYRLEMEMRDLEELPGAEPSVAALSLLHAEAGRTVRIRALCASPEVACQLREIGLHEGRLVRLVTRGANIICQVCNVRLALNARVARTIMVEQLAT